MIYIELDVWKEARKLVSSLYEKTKSFPKEETYGLPGQMRRAAISIPSKIAEGCGRRTSSIQFNSCISLRDLCTNLKHN